MQFLTVAIASFSLGSQVLAAPLSATVTVNGVTSELKNLPGQAASTVGSVVKRAIDGFVSVESLPLDPSSVTTEVTSAAGGALDTVSAVESIAARSAFYTVVGSVSTLKTSVESELTIITSTVGSDVTSSIVPTVHSSLSNIIGAVNGTVSTVVPTVVGLALPLAAGEVEAVISLVGEVESLVTDIKTTLGDLVGSLESDVIALLAPEIDAVLALVLPFVVPIVGFARNVAGTVVGTDAATELLSAASSLTGVVDEVLSPVTGLLGAL